MSHRKCDCCRKPVTGALVWTKDDSGKVTGGFCSESCKQKGRKETFIRVTARIDEDGVTVYSHEGVDVALKLPPKGDTVRGSVVDLREHPPFLAMSPCPYCGTLNDRGHDPTAHTDPFLGTPVENVGASEKKHIKWSEIKAKGMSCEHKLSLDEEITILVFDLAAACLDEEFKLRINP